jgi:WD40 repeat protein
MEYSTDGKLVVTDGDDGRLRVWATADGRLVREIQPGVGAISAFALKSDSKTAMVTGLTNDADVGGTRRVAVVELASGNKVADNAWREDEPAYHVALCAERALVATLALSGIAELRNAGNGALLWKFELDGIATQRIVIAPDGRWLLVIQVSSSPDLDHAKCQAIVFDLFLHRELRRMAEPGYGFNDVAVLPGANKILLATSDLVLWDVTTAKQDRLTKLYLSKLAISPGGLSLVGSKMLGDFTVWETASLKQTGSLPVKLGQDDTVAIAPDGRTVVSTTGRTILRHWDVETKQERHTIPRAHTGTINDLLFADDGKILVSASDDGTACVWDVRSGRQQRVMSHEGAVKVLALAPNGKLLLTGVESRPWVYLWDLEKNSKPTILSDGFLGTTPVAVQFTAEDQTVAMFDQNGGWRRWDLKRREIKEKFQARLKTRDDPDHPDNAGEPEAQDRPRNSFPFPLPADFFYEAAFLADGRNAAVLGRTGFHVVDPASGQKRLVHPNVVLFAASPDQRTLAIASDEGGLLMRPPNMDGRGSSKSGAVTLLDSTTGKTIRELKLPGTEIWAAAFSRDGKTLAVTSGRETGKVHLFDLASGNEFQTIVAPPMRSKALAFSPDGSLLATGMLDTSILIFEVRPHQ